MSERDKKNWSQRLFNYPLLHMALHDKWLRLALIGFVTICLGFIVLLLPVIRSTPKDFQPTAKIRLLDWVQSKALSRTARSSAAAGKFEQSFFAYRMAIANDPGNISLYREYLNTLKNSPFNQESVYWSRRIDSQMVWLLRLSDNDLSDILLCASVMDQFGRVQTAAKLVAGAGTENTSEMPVLQSYLIKQAFHDESWRQFQNLWMKLTGSSPLEDLNHEKIIDAGLSGEAAEELRLYQLAYLALNQKNETAFQTLLELSRPTSEGSETSSLLTRTLFNSNQLLLRVCPWLGKSEEFYEAKSRLNEFGFDSPINQCFEWPILALNDVDEAQSAARQWIKKETIEEFSDALSVNRILSRLGWKNLQSSYLEKCRTVFAHAEPRIWLIHADFLIADKRWTLLKSLAAELQNDSQIGSKLKGLGLFFEGLAESNVGLKSKAERLLEQSAETELPTTGLTQYVASGLLNTDHPELARRCLSQLEESELNSPTMAALLFEIATAEKNAAEALKAAGILYDSNPDFPVFFSNMASALISAEENPDLAIELAEKTRGVMPPAPAFAINTAMAYLLKEDASSARKILEPFESANKGSLELEFWNYAWARIHTIEGDQDKAREFAEKIDLASLYPDQRKRLAMLEQ